MNSLEPVFDLAHSQGAKNSLNGDAYQGTCHSGSAAQFWVLQQLFAVKEGFFFR